MFETWYQVERFLMAGKIDLDPILTHVIPWKSYHDGFKLMQSGEGIKIVMDIAGQ
jgi:threonine 3-dehydrogenase